LGVSFGEVADQQHYWLRGICATRNETTKERNNEIDDLYGGNLGYWQECAVGECGRCEARDAEFYGPGTERNQNLWDNLEIDVPLRNMTYAGIWCPTILCHWWY
jgi:hypothetical protein